MSPSGTGKSTQIGSSDCSQTSAWPGVDILPLLHMAQSEPAGERRGDGLLRDGRLHLLHRGGGGIALGDGLIEHRLRDRALFDELRPGARNRALAWASVALLSARSASSTEVSSLTSLAPFCDVVAAVEEIVGDHAAQLRRHVHAFDGDQRADGMHPVGPAFGPGLLGRHRRRRRHHLPHELADHLRLEHEIEIADPAQEQGDDDGGDEKALNHGACCLQPSCQGDCSEP